LTGFGLFDKLDGERYRKKTGSEGKPPFVLFKRLAAGSMARRRRIQRRQILRLGFAAASAMVFPAGLSAAVRKPAFPEKRLSFFNTHTAERLEICYGAAGRYDAGALARINHILRDHRTGAVGAIATGLLDLLHALTGRLDTTEPLHVISGYRSPETNAVLHAKSRGVASRSLHVCGQAIDIRVPGIRTAALRDTALSLSAGGVGYYPGPDFVHVDIGPVRSWG
jgi:uncharacterized protein YcbK (DUF882 family)